MIGALAKLVMPAWAPWAAAGALLVLVGAQQVRISGLHTDVAHAETALANEKAARSAEEAQRQALVATDAKNRADAQAAHAAQLQENDNAWRSKLSEKDRMVAGLNRTLAGLRSDRAAYTAASGLKRAGETDAVALARATDRLQSLAAMGERSDGLLERAAGIIRQRDIEVTGLLEVIKADRAACTRTPTPASPEPAPS